MLVLSTDTLPDNLKIKEVHGFLETTLPVEISNKGLFRNVFEKNRNEHDEAYDVFVKSAGNRGNLIYGVKISTAIGSFNNGTFLYITYYGTLATAEYVD